MTAKIQDPEPVCRFTFLPESTCAHCNGTRVDFDGIFEPTPSRPVMSRPPRATASRDLIRATAAELRIIGINLPPDMEAPVADWLADKLHRFVALTSRPVFGMDGSGPECSSCGQVWPLCGHHHLSAWINPDDNQEGQQ